MIKIGFTKILDYNNIEDIKEGDIIQVALFTNNLDKSKCILKEYLITKDDIRNIDIGWVQNSLINDEDITNYKYDCKFINSSEFIQLLIISVNTYRIKYIENPTLFIQKIAVHLNPKNLGRIKNLYKEVQLIAINKTSWFIGYIDNPCLEVCQHALYLDRGIINVLRSNIDCYDEVLEFYNFLYRI